jgi:hypothetical protein
MAPATSSATRGCSLSPHKRREDHDFPGFSAAPPRAKQPHRRHKIKGRCSPLRSSGFTPCTHENSGHPAARVLQHSRTSKRSRVEEPVDVQRGQPILRLVPCAPGSRAAPHTCLSKLREVCFGEVGCIGAPCSALCGGPCRPQRGGEPDLREGDSLWLLQGIMTPVE